MKKNGFSLIELLIALAVIGILAAVAIPSYIGAQGRAKMKSATEEANSLAAAMELYYQERNNYGPDGVVSGNALTARYTSFKPSSDSIFNYEVTVGNNGQTFDIKITTIAGQEFPSNYTEFHLDQNNQTNWVK